MRAAMWGIVLLAAGPALAACSVDFGSPSRHEERSYEVPGAIHAVTVRGDSGSVEVVATDAKTISVRERLTFGSDRQRPVPQHPVQNGTLALGFRCPKGITIGFRECDVGYRVTVPRGTSVDVRTDSGRVALSGLSATVQAVTDSGAIVAEDISGTGLTARSDSGSVRISGAVAAVDADTDSGSIDAWSLHAAKITARTSSGAVRLGCVTAPDQVRATSDSGSVQVTVPDGPYAVDTRSDSGRRRIGVVQDPSATRHISVVTDSGSITVDKA